MSTYISPTAPIIGPNGIVAPTYAQLLAFFQSGYYSIFGSDAYIAPDSQDGQLLAIFTQAIADGNAAIIAAYNSLSPLTGQGAGLSNNVQLNGLTRLVPTFSVTTVTLVGQANTQITNGLLIDPNQNIWALPTLVQIPTGGSVSVTATCQTVGAVALTANSLTINTPTNGWQSVTNIAGTPGNPVETDAALRIRQSVSVALPSQTIFEGIVASIEQIPGVGRVLGYENNTSSPLTLFGGSIPANTLCFIVENGSSTAAIETAIFQAIFTKATPGIPTYKDPAYPANGFSRVVTDAAGSTRPINFMTPLSTPLNIAISIHALSGWSTTTISVIQAALAAYLNSLPIGSNYSYFEIGSVAQLPGTALGATYELKALQITATATFQTSDITLLYNAAPGFDALTVTLV